MKKINPRVGCILLTKLNNVYHVVLVKQQIYDSWNFPKGEIESNNIVDDLYREVHEETGLKSTDFELKARFKPVTIFSNNITYQLTLFVGLLNSKKKLEPIDTNEIKDCKYVPYTVAISYFNKRQPIYSNMLAKAILLIDKK